MNPATLRSIGALRLAARLSAALGLSAVALSLLALGPAPQGDEPELRWRVPYPSSFDRSLLREQDLLRVEGNHFVDEEGQPFVFRGVSIADPDRLAGEGRWDRSLFEELRCQWGVNAVRIPVHPAAWRGRGKEDYLQLIDQAVRWANEQGVYLIIDWHSIGFLPTEQFQHPMYDTTRKETLDFWRTIAFRYEGVPTTAVYELFNEPTTMGGTLGRANWSEWREFNELLIDMIRARDETVIPLVAGFDWAYDLTPVAEDPVRREGVAYAVHPYPQKVSQTPVSDEVYLREWQLTWGFVADTYPMIASELGWVRDGGYGAHVPVIDDGSYGPRIMTFMQSRGVSWIAWVFDPEWSPAMIENWEFEPTEQGAFFKRVLLAERRGSADGDRSRAGLCSVSSEEDSSEEEQLAED